MFFKAIQKYGWNNFEHKILFSDLDIETASKKERELIAKYKSNNKKFGYNIADGGLNNPTNEEQLNALRKPVYQYNLDGSFIEEYRSSTEALKNIDTSEYVIVPDGIDRVCSLGDMNRTRYGYRWSFKFLGDKIEPITIWQNLCIPVYQYDMEGYFIKKYNSMMEAERETGIDNSAICACCKGKRYFTKEFRWSYNYVENLPPFDKKKWKFETNIKSQMKPVYQYDLDGNFIKTYYCLT